MGREPGQSVICEVSAVSEGFVAVGTTGDLAPGEMKFVAVDRERIVLANIDCTLYALRDVCGHKNAPLSRGKLIGCLIECPLHFAQFDMRTGKLVDGPVSADVAVYEVRVEGDIIYVKR
jgi:nitrite reductase/ring-hydroxylating ferredoxin subunit